MIISFRYGSLALLALSLVSMLTCARDQQLTSIQIVPPAETFLSPDPNTFINLRALGNYIHPPVQKDITSEVTWASNTPDLVTVTAAGRLSPAQTAVCGGALVSATVQTNTAGNRDSNGAIITGYMTTTINNTQVQGCPGFTGNNLPILTLTVGGTGQGTLAVSPGGLNCTSAQVQCSTSFPVNTQVTITATPSGSSSFGQWSQGSCDSVPVSNECVVNLNNSRVVGAIFN